MSLATFNIVRPGQTNNAGSIQGNVVEEIDSLVEKTLVQKFVFKDYVDLKTLSKTNQLVRFSSGRSKIKRHTPGTTPNGDVAQFGKNLLTVDVHSFIRNIIPVLDELTVSFDARKELALEQAAELTRYYDRAFLIQACKAALATTSFYGTNGHLGGSQQVLTTAADAQDPALLTAAINRLYAKMAEKEVVDGITLVVRPSVLAVLREADHIINGDYTTNDGTKIKTDMLKYLGVPVIQNNQLPNSVIDNTDFVAEVAGADYEGDFSRVVALAVDSKKALMGAQLIAPKSKIFYDDMSKSHYIDTDFAFNVKPNRAECAGVVLLPTIPTTP